MKISKPNPTFSTSFAPMDLTQIPKKWRSHCRTLLRMRDAHLVETKRLFDLEKESGGKRTDELDAASDAAEGEVRLGLFAFEEGMLAEVEAALQRIHQGTYGICESTGRTIPSARLTAIPWTRFTAEAEQALAKHTRAPR
jgi:RNA polymerase-binding transcription factor DksA